MNALKLVIVLACLALVPNAMAQESRPAKRTENARGAHLEPRWSLSTMPAPAGVDYERVIRERLLVEASAGPVLFHFVCLPSFASEWAVCVSRPEQGNARIELRQARTNLSEAYGNPKRTREPEVTKATVRISAITAELLARAWIRMLEQTRTAMDDMPVFDGEVYDFAASTAGRELHGGTNSPPEASPCGRLVALAQTLREFVDAEEVDRPGIERALKRDAAELLMLLDAASDSRPASAPSSRPASQVRRSAAAAFPASGRGSTVACPRGMIPA